MIICPNFSNPEVAREFEELKNATSEAAAYHIWSLNNGNAIDRAPNGAPSKLFLTLLEYYGDRTKAIQAKAKVYGNSFLNWFGDWTGNATYEVYQGRTSELPDGRRYNYWSRYENDAKTYGPNVRKVRINPSGFLIKNEQRWRTNLNGERVFGWGWSEEYERVIEEFKAQTGYDYFDILENGEEGLKKQNKFFEFLESKGYKGYAESNEFELQGVEHDNPYTVTFGNNGVIDSDVSKVVDENGEPLVVWHGTKNKFNVVDFSKSDDGISFFATDSKIIAAQYSGNNIVKREIQEFKERKHALKQAIAEDESEIKKIKRQISTGIRESEEFGEIELPENHIKYLKEEYLPFWEDRLRDHMLHLLEWDSPKLHVGNEISLFCSMKNPIIIPNAGNWFNIQFEGQSYTTRQIAKLAKDRGYDGVILRNAYDSPTFNVTNYDRFGQYIEPYSVYIGVSSPNLFKSATKNNGMFSTLNNNLDDSDDNSEKFKSYLKSLRDTLNCK